MASEETEIKAEFRRIKAEKMTHLGHSQDHLEALTARLEEINQQISDFESKMRGALISEPAQHPRKGF